MIYYYSNKRRGRHKPYYAYIRYLLTSYILYVYNIHQETLVLQYY